MEKVTKTFVSKIKSIDEKNFTLEAVVSDETVDRYGEVIKIDSWKKRLSNYKSHPVLLSSHSYNKLTNQIGFAEKVYVKEGELIAKFKYFVGEGNEEADWGWKLASKFGQAAYSVGFLPFNFERLEEKDYEDAKQGKKPYITYTDVELLEVSQVLVPANPSALAKGMETEQDLVIKEYTEIILKDIDKLEDKEDFNNLIEKDLGDVVKKEAIIEKEVKEKGLGVENNKEDDTNKEEELMKSVIDEIKALKEYFDEKFAPLEKRLKLWDEEDELVDDMADDYEDFLKEKNEKEKTDEENYIKKLIADMNIIAKHIPVQSKDDNEHKES